MPGRGPAPKAPEQRRRRNNPERGEWTDLPEVDKPVLPDLPKRKSSEDDPVGKWHARTRAAWVAWRKDPATTQYGPAEIASAIELAYVFDAAVRGKEKMSEVRLREDRLGLSSKGKRDLRWRAPTETVAANDVPDEEAKPLTPVRRLRAVG